MTNQAHKEIFLKDYQVSNYLIETVNLCFQLAQEKTTVQAEVVFYQNPKGSKENDLTLNG